MSVFRRFQLPQLLRKRKSDEKSIVNIRRFDCNALAVREWLGQDSFGDVYTVDYQAPRKVIETVVMKKVLPALDQKEKKLFYKEVALLNGLNHPNIVKMKGMCQNPLAIMLEYCYFDFKPFGEDFHFTNYRFSLRFVPFRLANYSKPCHIRKEAKPLATNFFPTRQK